MKLTYYSDPSHGWLKTPIKLLKAYGIFDKISGYSYVRGNYAYLEEDCDMSFFLKTAKAKGETHTIEEKFTNRSSKIRSYRSFPSKDTEQITFDEFTEYILR